MSFRNEKKRQQKPTWVSVEKSNNGTVHISKENESVRQNTQRHIGRKKTETEKNKRNNKHWENSSRRCYPDLFFGGDVPEIDERRKEGGGDEKKRGKKWGLVRLSLHTKNNTVNNRENRHMSARRKCIEYITKTQGRSKTGKNVPLSNTETAKNTHVSTTNRNVIQRSSKIAQQQKKHTHNRDIKTHGEVERYIQPRVENTRPAYG